MTDTQRIARCQEQRARIATSTRQRRRKSRRSLPVSRRGAVMLWVNVMRQAVRDLKSADPRLRMSAEWFLREAPVVGEVLELFDLDRSRALDFLDMEYA